MRKFIYLLLIGFALLVLCLNIYDRFNPRTIKQKQNVENIIKVQVGMLKGEVLQVMGNPYLIIPPIKNSPFYQYIYETNYDSFTHIRVMFDSTMSVQKISLPYQLKIDLK